jgi:fibronectin-binding autotransporter adhesin
MTDCTVAGNTAGTGPGGGLFIGSSRTLEMTRCAVRDNRITGASSFGGGIYTAGTTTLTDCLIEANSAARGAGIAVEDRTTILTGTTTVQSNHADLDEASLGGGILVFAGTLNIEETCRVTHNTAFTGRGGGIWNNGGAVTLQGTADPSPIVVDNCQENCAGPGGVPKCSPALPDPGVCPGPVITRARGGQAVSAARGGSARNR